MGRWFEIGSGGGNEMGSWFEIGMGGGIEKGRNSELEVSRYEQELWG